MKTFLKMLPLFFSLMVIEFFIWFFLFLFWNDISTVNFLRMYPVILRLSLSLAFVSALVPCFITSDYRYVFIGISANLLLIIILLETFLFHSLDPVYKAIASGWIYLVYSVKILFARVFG